MKKVLSLIAAVALLASVSFAQKVKYPTQRMKNSVEVHKVVKPTANRSLPKAAGDTVTVFPWTESFDAEPFTGFSFVDADNDGNNWTFGPSSNMNVHSGTGCIFSASWYDGDVLTPDNWMILPAIALPSNANDFTLSWWARGQDPSYAVEHYSVYVCTTGNTPANFTATTAAYDGYSTDDYVKYSVDLSSYAGQTIYVAFRHWNISDMFYLNIDDIRIGGGEAPEVTVSGPANAELGVATSFTATGATTFTWTVDGTDQSETGATLSYTFTTIGSHVVKASATNDNGTGADSVFVDVYDCSQAISEFPWNESFEGSIDCWQFVTLDETSTGFSLYSQYGHTGSNSIIGAYSDDSDVDQWAISPMVAIPSNASNFILKYYVYLNNWEGVMSEYEVRIATVSSNAISTNDFTTVLFTEEGETEDFVARSVDLSAYAGQTIRIAFRNITAQTGDAMLIDDIYIGAPLTPDLTISGPEDVRTGEPYTFTALSDATTFAWAVNGVDQSETGAEFTYTFPTAGTYSITATATNSVGSTVDTLEVTAIECTTHDLPFVVDLSQEFDLCWEMQGDGWQAEQLDGEYVMYSMSNLYGFFDLNPDNWIISPSLAMPESGQYEISYKVSAYEPSLPADHYGVYVISGGQPTLLFEETLDNSAANFRSRFVTIPSTVTGDFKIAFRHFNTPSGGFIILIKDIKVDAVTEHEGIDNATTSNISVYPNPVRNTLTVDGEDVIAVQVIDINGRNVVNTNESTVDMSGLSNGIYFVKVITSTGAYTTKVVKR